MTMQAITRAIDELESATDTLLATEFSDWNALRQALERRADAITILALTADAQTPAPFGDSVERLTAILVRGEEATRRLLEARRGVGEEFSRLKQLVSSIGVAEPHSSLEVQA